MTWALAISTAWTISLEAWATDRHIVFNLEGVLTQGVPEANLAFLDKSKIITVNGAHYRIADGAIEALRRLAAMPDVKISFFTDLPKDRTEALLQALQLTADGSKTAKSIAFRILTKEDQTTENPPKKDLSKVSTDLNNLLFFDRDATRVVDAHQGNVVSTGPVFFHYDSFEQAQKKAAEMKAANESSYQQLAQSIPQAEQAYRLHQARVIAAFDIADKSLNTRGKPLVKAAADASKIDFQGHVEAGKKTLATYVEWVTRPGSLPTCFEKSRIDPKHLKFQQAERCTRELGPPPQPVKPAAPIASPRGNAAEIIINLDSALGTLVPSRSLAEEFDRPHTFQLSAEQSFILHPGAEDVLRELLRQPDVKISFTSEQATRYGLDAILSAIKISEKPPKTARDLAARVIPAAELDKADTEKVLTIEGTNTEDRLRATFGAVQSVREKIKAQPLAEAIAEVQKTPATELIAKGKSRFAEFPKTTVPSPTPSSSPAPSPTPSAVPAFAPSTPAKPTDKHLVLSLDELVFSLEKGCGSLSVKTAQKEECWNTDVGPVNSLRRLLLTPGLRVSFVSKLDRAKTQELLDFLAPQIYPQRKPAPRGRDLAFHVLTAEDAKNNQWDLRKITPRIDDVAVFLGTGKNSMMQGQEKSVIRSKDEKPELPIAAEGILTLVDPNGPPNTPKPPKGKTFAAVTAEAAAQKDSSELNRTGQFIAARKLTWKTDGKTVSGCTEVASGSNDPGPTREVPLEWCQAELPTRYQWTGADSNRCGMHTDQGLLVSLVSAESCMSRLPGLYFWTDATHKKCGAFTKAFKFIQHVSPERCRTPEISCDTDDGELHVLSSVSGKLVSQTVPDLAQKISTLASAQEQNPRVSPTSFASILLDDTINGSLMKAIGESCGRFLQTLYRSGKTLRSERIVKAAFPLKDMRYFSGRDDLVFFHYTKSWEVQKLFKSEDGKRDKTPEEIFTTGAHDEVFRHLRTAATATWGMLHYIAEDPESSGHYGPIQLRITMKPEANALRYNQQTFFDAFNELSVRLPELRRHCSLVSPKSPASWQPGEWAPSGVLYGAVPIFPMILEDSGIDVFDYYGEAKWFQLTSPRGVSSITVK